MANIFNFKEIQFNKIRCGPIKKISKNFMIIPISYFKKPLIIQTPLLLLPFGLCENMDYNKIYIKMKFPRLQNDKQFAFQKFLIDLEQYIKDTKYEKIWRKLRRKLTNKEFKSSLNPSKNIFTCQLLDASTIYDEENKSINRELVIANSRIKSICILSGLWIHKNSMGFLWSIPQLKVYSSPINTCLIIDDPVKITPETREIECPCCGGNIEVIPKILPPETKIQYIQVPTSEDGEDHIFGKFAKMCSLGVPLEAVKHKLKFEGLDANAFDAYMKRKKSKKTSINVSITQTSGNSIGRPAMAFSMNDLLGQRNNLKKAKKRKKIIDDKGFTVTSAMKQTNSNVLVPTLQDIIGSMKSLKSTGIKLS
jgi:hypothetical protein